MLIKEESFRIRQPQTPANGSRRKPSRAPVGTPSHRFWQAFFFGFLTLIASTLLAGLLQVKTDLVSNYQKKFDSFRWIVMVEGDQLQSDEVGRYLKQLDGVSAVTYVSSIEAFQTIAQNPIFSDELKDINPDFLPSSWEVQWQVDQRLTVESLKEILSEISSFPGILDVAFDLNAWNDIQKLNEGATRLRVVLSLTAFLFVFWSLLFLGKLLFFTPLQWIGWKPFVGTVALTAVFWAGGFLMIGSSLGFPHEVFLLGGILIGLMRGLWRCQATS